MTVCTRDSLAGEVFLVMSNLQSEKIGFSRGVALPYAPMTVSQGVFLVMSNLQSYKSGVVFWYGPMKS